MEIKVYKTWNPDAIRKTTPNKKIRESFERTDSILSYLKELKPKIAADYVTALTKRLTDVVKDFEMDTGFLDKEEITKDLEHLNAHPDLSDAITLYVFKHLDLPETPISGSKEIEVKSLNNTKANERLAYHTSKAFADVLGDEEAIPLWKRVVAKRLEARKARYEKRMREREEKGEGIPTLTEERERAIKIWSEIGLGDFAVCIFDEHSEVFRFDKCITHEALKDLEDPDWAYLSTCYIGDASEYNSVGTVYLRRTQTLHHGAFCDEFYWDNRFHKDPKQPTLEFTQNISRNQDQGKDE
jgi:hypothetical protein